MENCLFRVPDDGSPGRDADRGLECCRPGSFGSQGAQTVGHGALQRVLEEELLGWPRGQHHARPNQHREGQGAGQKMAAALHLIPEPRSFWSDRARAAFEQNVFAPEYKMDDAMAIDHEAVITEYKEMKTFLQTSNTH